MKSRARWYYLVSALAVAFVAVSSVVAAIRQGSWAPIVAVGWMPAVVVASWPGARHRCRPGRGANRPA